MEKKRMIEQTSWECDGCDYVLGVTLQEKADGLTREEVTTMLDIPWREMRVVFHFHGPEREERHDCFRYWATNPHIMKRSLKNRCWRDEEIDEFMAIHLYREKVA